MKRYEFFFDVPGQMYRPPIVKIVEALQYPRALKMARDILAHENGAENKDAPLVGLRVNGEPVDLPPVQ